MGIEHDTHLFFVGHKCYRQKLSMIRLFLCKARLRLSREHRLLADFAETKQSKALVEGLR